jgi:16S rRNA (cytosine967-C5)-methyltransferase
MKSRPRQSAAARQPDARAAALHLLGGVLRRGQPLDEGFDAAAAGLEERDRAFARLLTATALRRLGQIDAVLAAFVERPPPPLVQDILRLSAAQLLFVGTPAHAAVATAVDLARRRHQTTFTGLVNAVLRRVADQGPRLVAAQDALRLNTPDWLWRRWCAAYGEDRTRAIAAVHLVEAPVDLTAKDDTAAWASALQAEVLPTGSLRLHQAGRVTALPGFAAGAWWVQDAAAALPARLLMAALGAPQGRTAIDLCAAPGGKTLQLAAAGCAVTAVDTSARRLHQLRDNLARTSLAAEVVKADALTWRPAAPADALLLDAPCTATGTIRRHPDLPYLKSADDIARLARRQGELLRAAAAMLRPGGVLVYSVCSLEPEEGEGVVAAALADGLGCQRETVSAAALPPEFVTAAGDLRTLPCQWPERGGLDGFYAAVLRKL